MQTYMKHHPGEHINKTISVINSNYCCTTSTSHFSLAPLHTPRFSQTTSNACMFNRGILLAFGGHCFKSNSPYNRVLYAPFAGLVQSFKFHLGAWRQGPLTGQKSHLGNPSPETCHSECLIIFLHRSPLDSNIL